MTLEISPELQTSANATDAARVLFRDLIDYAGLFPPASMTMAASVASYDAYSRSEWSWILGRFIVPVARLGEFKEALCGLPSPVTGFKNWRLSVLLGADIVADVARFREFAAGMANCSSDRRIRTAIIESMELKVTSAEEITRLSAVVPAELGIYFEVPLSNCAECIAAVARCGRRAKIRTGGETIDKFPAPESVVEFMQLCAKNNVAFKATAGLHHPLRSAHRLTYQPESPSGLMHGFMNVFLAAAFLRRGMEPKIAIQLLAEQAESAFHFDSKEVSWGEHRLSRNEIETARQDFAVSFGSCSFTEPIDDLRSLRLL